MNKEISLVYGTGSTKITSTHIWKLSLVDGRKGEEQNLPVAPFTNMV